MNRLLDNFDLLLDAPDSVPKLRALILDLAVRGRLVDQNPADEPASALLERIAAEKKQLAKEGKIRKPKKLPPIESDEVAFEALQGWEWVRLGEVGDWGAGATPSRGNPKYFAASGTPWLKTGELNDGYISNSEEYVTEKALQDCSLRLNQPGDVLIAMYGATIGKLGILEIEATTNQACCACTPFTGIFNRYLFLYLLSLRSDLRSLGSGGAQPNISKQKIVANTFPLPPLAEQQRIVARVDELMRLCDGLEEQQQKQQTTRVRLGHAALDTLLAADEYDFPRRWQFVHDHFDLLYADPQNVARLKQAILQLAVQGKLVAQDPANEPASALLEHIEAEKKQLYKEGKIRKPKKLPPIESDEVPFDVPEGWEWVHVNSFAGLQSGYAFKSEWYTEDGIRLARNANVSHGTLDWGDTARIPFDLRDEFESFELEEGDLLISLDRPLISTGLKAAKVREVDLPALLLQRVGRFVFYGPGVINDYVYTWLTSPAFIEVIDPGRSNGVPHISQKDITSMLFPLPPLAEQQRIVARVDELMHLCNRLEARLEQSKEQSERLLEAVLHAAFTDGETVPDMAEMT